MVAMKASFLWLSVSAAILFLAACAAPPPAATQTPQQEDRAEPQPTYTAMQSGAVQPTGGATETAPPPEPEEPAAGDCLGGERSQIAESITEDYEGATYEEVVAWFCAGAEFEDILVALETEVQSGVPVEEQLVMLADGFSWDEIWQVVGLTE